MTRSEFIEGIQFWGDLLNFCYDEGCSNCDDVYPEDSKDEYFDDELVNMAREADSWRDMYEKLGDIPTGYDYYIRDEYDEWRGADIGDFDYRKDDVLEWGDNRGIWDEEDEMDEDELDEDEPDEDELDEECGDEEEDVEEGCPLSELFTSCTSKLQTIRNIEEQERKREEQRFEQFITVEG